MAKAKAKTAEPEQTGPSSADALGALVEQHKDEHFVYVHPKHTIISTGSLILDSLVKVRSGGVVRLVGKGAELGKTSEAFVLADNYMKTMPKAKSIYFKAEARLTPEIIKRSGLRFVFKPEDWQEGTVFVYPVNVFEVFAETLERLLPQMYEAGEHLCVILDSLDGLMLRSDKTKTVWAEGKGAENVKVAGVPLLTKLLFRRLGLPITHFDVLMLITGQYSADIQIDPRKPTNPRQADSAGGNALAHQSDYVFQYTPRYNGDLILENEKEKPDWRNNKTLGVYATLEIKKSGTDVTGSKVKIPIKKGRIGNAIWVEREIVDMLLGYELFKKKSEGGSWLAIDETLRADIKRETNVDLPDKVNGENNAYKLLEDNPAVIPYLFSYFTKLNGGEETA